MTALPAAWTLTSLGDICLEMRNGISTKPVEDAGTAILRISAVRSMKLDASDVRFLPADMQGVEPYRLRADDLLFTRYNGNRELVGACARVRQVDRDLVYPDKLIRVRVDSRVASPGFVEAVSNSADAREYIDLKLKTSAGQVGISGADLKGLPILLPPLREQQRIVAKLNTLLGRVDACRERLERVGPLIKRFRQSVLTLAATGGLTAEWRSRRQQIPESRVVQIGEDELSIPVNWRLVPLGQLIDPARPLCYGVVQPGEVASGGVPLIRVQDLGLLEAGVGGMRTVSPEIDAAFRRSRTQGGDLLVSVVGTIGRVAIVPDGMKANIARAVARVACQPELVKGWALHWLSSPAAQWWLSNTSREVARKTLNLADLASLPVPLPPVDEQHELIRRVDILLGSAARLSERETAVRHDLSRTVPSTLAKAFRGELVPQDPNDEPASALLARLRAQRDAAAPPTNAKRARRARSGG